MTTTTPFRELFAAPLQPDWTIDSLAERLLAVVADEPADEPLLTFDDLTDRQSQRLIRPLLACLARMSEAETGTPVNLYGGTLSFVRKRKSGEVRITGEFENRPGSIRLSFHRPEPAALVDSPRSVRPARSRLFDVIVPEVRNYRANGTGFALADDLQRLDWVRESGAHEATILYCTRVVEAMARSAVYLPDRLPSETMAGLLWELVEYRKMPKRLKSWLDTLRYLGNDARHATRPVSEADADVAFVVLLKWLHWTFCEAPDGPRLASVTVYNRPADGLLPRELARLMDDADANGDDVLAQLTGPDPSRSPALLTPMVPAAAAESLLTRGRLPAAWQILEVALRRFPRDLRLRQLVGLYWSRRGKDERSVELLLKAQRVLESHLPHAGGSTEDEETFGILAGVYKRLADLDPTDATKWLERSFETYCAGWLQSRRTNYYLGINAAAMAILQGQPGEVAERVAGPIRDGIAALEERLRTSGSSDRPLTYWDQVTWAEAELLMGEWYRAGELYRNAFTRFASHTADIQVTAEQALRILDRFGKPELAAGILGRWLPTQ